MIPLNPQALVVMSLYVAGSSITFALRRRTSQLAPMATYPTNRTPTTRRNMETTSSMVAVEAGAGEAGVVMGSASTSTERRAMERLEGAADQLETDEGRALAATRGCCWVVGWLPRWSLHLSRQD